MSNEIELNDKQRLRISKSTWNILEEDRKRFGSVKVPLTRDSFYNTIVKNALEAKMPITQIDDFVNSFVNKHSEITESLNSTAYKVKREINRIITGAITTKVPSSQLDGYITASLEGIQPALKKLDLECDDVKDAIKKTIADVIRGKWPANQADRFEVSPVYKTVMGKLNTKTIFSTFEDLVLEAFDQYAPDKSDPLDKPTTINLKEKDLHELPSHIRSSKIQKVYTNGKDSSNIGDYINLILEAYAHLPYAERTRIFCYGIYTQLQESIEHEDMVNITHNNGTEFSFIPSKITKDAMGVYLYVYGKVYDRTGADPEMKYPYDCSFRLERILSIGRVGQSEKLKAMQKEELQSTAHEKKPAYMLSGMIRASFQLSERGEDLLNSILINRPDGIVKDKKTGRYECKATESELFNYLKRLGPEVDDLQPKELRDRLCNHFRSCFEHYQQMSDKAE